MESRQKDASENEIVRLREGIKQRYLTYHVRNGLRFPLLEFNTNRFNYEPLRESFEEEFFVIRGMDRQQKTIYIPSTNTLSLLFTDDSYVPSQKILNTCWSYAENQPETTPVELAPISGTAQAAPAPRNKWMLPAGTGLVAGLLLGFGLNWNWSKLTFRQLELTAQNSALVHQLKIDRPVSKSHVSSTFVVSGQASPGSTVWFVTRLDGTDFYYVQYPALVDHRGFWFEAINISGGGYDKAGKTHQLRAFVNPRNELRVSDILRSWPEAEYSTGIVEIVMDPKATLGE